MNDTEDMGEMIAEKNEPDIHIINENVEIIVIDSDEEPYINENMEIITLMRRTSW